MEQKYIVYMHKNKINEKKYIGITCQRFEYRCGKNGNNYEECPRFWGAIQKYGWDNFEHIVLLSGLTKEEACEKEKELIEKHQTRNKEFGYNLSKGGDMPDSDYMRDLWKNNEYKTFASNQMRIAWQDAEKRKKRSNAAKERWSKEEFKQKASDAVMKACSVKVQCIETGVIYSSRKEASDALGVCGANISRAIRTGYQCGGYHWQYANMDNAL